MITLSGTPVSSIFHVSALCRKGRNLPYKSASSAARAPTKTVSIFTTRWRFSCPCPREAASTSVTRSTPSHGEASLFSVLTTSTTANPVRARFHNFIPFDFIQRRSAAFPRTPLMCSAALKITSTSTSVCSCMAISLTICSN